jgi:hypothetical protein
MCFHGAVKAVHLGNIVDPHGYGNDGGMGIYFTSENDHLHAIDNLYNMNDSQGHFMFSQLAHAIARGFKIKAFDNRDDNWNEKCDKINQISLIAIE